MACYYDYDYDLFQLAVCGDGIVDPGEQCDDGNGYQHDDCAGSIHPSLQSINQSIIQLPTYSSVSLSWSSTEVHDH